MQDPFAQLRSHADNPAMGHLQGFLTDLVGTLENLVKEFEAGVEDRVNALVSKAMSEFSDGPIGGIGPGPDPVGPEGPKGPTGDDSDDDEHVNENS